MKPFEEFSPETIERVESHIGLIRSRILDGTVTILGSPLGDIINEINEVKSGAYDYAESKWHEAEVVLFGIAKMFGSQQVPKTEEEDPLKGDFIGSFAAGMSKQELAFQRLLRLDSDQEATEHLDAQEREYLVERMFDEYVSFNGAMSGRKVSSNNFKRNPFIRFSLEDVETELAKYRDVLPENMVKKIIMDNLQPVERLRQIELAYFDLVEHYPEADDYYLKILALRYTDRCIEVAERRFAIADNIFEEHPNIPQQIVYNLAVTHKDPEASIKTLINRSNKVLLACPKIPSSIALRVAYAQPRNAVAFATELEKVVEETVPKYEGLPRDAIYYLVLSWGLSDVERTIDRVMKEVDEFHSVFPKVSKKRLIRAAFSNPNEATKRMQAHVDSLSIKSINE